MEDLRTRFARAIAQNLLDEHGAERAVELVRRGTRDPSRDGRALHDDVRDALDDLGSPPRRLLN